MSDFSLSSSSLLGYCRQSSSNGPPFAQDDLLSVKQRELLSLLLDRYLAAMEKKETVSVEELTEDCPELRAALTECVAGLQALHDLAAGADQDLFQRSLFTIKSLSPDLAVDFELGDFVLHEVIGQGGMGVVYKATQKSLHRTVALKVLPTVKAITESQMLRFQREAELAASLQHPNIIPVYAVGFEAGLHYYAMQLIDGYSLDHQQAKSSRLSASHATDRDSSEAVNKPTLVSDAPCQWTDWREVLRLGIQAADGLHAAHEEGIVHRDIKPSNLLVNRDGKLWIADFGLARVSNDSSLTRSGDLVGTMRYMSPEQARGNAATVDGRSDIYSLGVTLYELLAGRPAFDSNDTVALLRAIDQEDPPSLRQFRRDIPLSLVAVLRKAMSKKRDARYDTASAFRKDLQRVLDSRATEAQMPGVVDQLQGLLVRHRHAATVAALAMFMLVLGLGINNARLQELKNEALENWNNAEASAAIARETVDSLGQQIAKELEGVPGAQAARRKLLEGTLTHYERLAEVAGGNSVLDTSLAKTHAMIGGLRLELGQKEQAVKAMLTARDLFRQQLERKPEVAETKMEYAISLNNLARALNALGQIDASRKAYEEAIVIEEELWSTGYLSVAPELATARNNLGLLLSSLGESKEAIRNFEAALEVLAEEKSQEMLKASIQANMVSLVVEATPEAMEPIAREALEILEQKQISAPQDIELAIKTSNTLNALGIASSHRKDYREALSAFSKSHDLVVKIAEQFPNDPRLEQHVVVALNHLGVVYCQSQDFQNGAFYLEMAVKRQRELVRQLPNEKPILKQMSQVLKNLSNCYLQAGDKERSDRSLKEYQELRAIGLANHSNPADGLNRPLIAPVSLTGQQ
jgi:eukaryotic-like serine/threonine-protein kinase